jgi:hypothetical protein
VNRHCLPWNHQCYHSHQQCVCLPSHLHAHTIMRWEWGIHADGPSGSSAPASAGCDIVKPKPTALLDLDDHLLCEIFSSLSVRDKQQYVQRTCLRFRSVLQRPSLGTTWGCITVKLQPPTRPSPQDITRLITWVLDRKSGGRHTSPCPFMPTACPRTFIIAPYLRTPCACRAHA